MERNLPINELTGAANKLALRFRCETAIASENVPDEAKNLSRVVLATLDTPVDKLSVIYPKDLKNISASMLQFGLITQDEHDYLISLITVGEYDSIADELVLRKQEYDNYQKNIDNYVDMLNQLPADLPNSWPTELLPFRKMTRQKALATYDGPDEDLLLNLLLRDELNIRIKQERAEQKVPALKIDVLTNKIPENIREQVIENAKMRLNIQ